MKKALLLTASVSLLLLAGCQKNGVAPKQDSVSTKKSILNQSLNKTKDTIMVGGQAAPSLNRRDTIMVSGK
ncbi:hypothetical protein ACEN9X_16240 [Mucilaginibacter sp. Mucisp86]|uniref:hypothetical protein n=1 Tax=Mucilaginibacter sp. Mucisp86 TaxID=3243060 RepID=UPI0039B4F3A2